MDSYTNRRWIDDHLKEEGMQMQKREREKTSMQVAGEGKNSRYTLRVCVCVCVCVREGEVYLVGVDREAGLAEHLPDLGTSAAHLTLNMRLNYRGQVCPSERCGPLPCSYHTRYTCD